MVASFFSRKSWSGFSFFEAVDRDSVLRFDRFMSFFDTSDFLKRRSLLVAAGMLLRIHYKRLARDMGKGLEPYSAMVGNGYAVGPGFLG